ncbi:hypothetical protein [Streptomyces sp. NPDC058157]|uniref:hypothetical protein n=1 Tax=Streptomyces sp. NPDC058157 TaxID=3346360 RepID=UPI0036E6B129
MEDAAQRPARSLRRQQFEAVHKWSSTAAAVVALAISLYNFAALQRQPEIDMALPHLFRLEKLGNDVRFYVQPTVSARVKSENVEVIRDARLRLALTGGSSADAPVFYWRESVTWYFNPDTGTVDNHWGSDPAPFIVSQDQAQQPSFAFRAGHWMYRAGRYEGSLELLRSGNRAPLTKKFCLVISDAAVHELENPQPPEQTIRFFRNDLPKFASYGSSADCYRRDTD